MEIDATKKVKVNAKTLRLHLKVCDRFTCSIEDQDGDVLMDYDDYVPGFMPGEHFGDYVILDIDIDSGKITNWNPTPDQIEEFVNLSDDDE
jgi:hypothetical protein